MKQVVRVRRVGAPDWGYAQEDFPGVFKIAVLSSCELEFKITRAIEKGDKFFEMDTREEITVISGPHRDYFPAMTPQSDSVYLVNIELGEKNYHQLMSEDDLLRTRRLR